VRGVFGVDTARYARRRETPNIPIMDLSTIETPEKRKSFEETYPNFPFAELVRLGIAVARLIVRRKRRGERVCPEAKAGTYPTAVT